MDILDWLTQQLFPLLSCMQNKQTNKNPRKAETTLAQLSFFSCSGYDLGLSNQKHIMQNMNQMVGLVTSILIMHFLTEAVE